jgi:hypothetical protein
LTSPQPSSLRYTIFLFSIASVPAPGTHPATYAMGTSVFVPGGKRPGPEADHSLTHSAPSSCVLAATAVSLGFPQFTFSSYSSDDSLGFPELGGNCVCVKKSKCIPRGGPQSCETLGFPHYLENRLTVGGEGVTLMRRPPGRFQVLICVERLSRTQEHSAAGRIR